MPGGGGYVSPTIWSPPRLSASEELTTEQLVRAHGTFPTGASLLRTVLAHIRVPRLPCPAWPCQDATLKAFEATLDRGAPPLVPTRAFGRVDAGVRLPIISLGAWQFGHQAQLNSKRPMLGPITEQKTAPSTLSHPLPTLSPPLAPPVAGAARTHLAVRGLVSNCVASTIAAGVFTAAVFRQFSPSASPLRLVVASAIAGTCAACGSALCAAEAFNADIVAHIAAVTSEARSRRILHLETARLYNTSEQVVSNALDTLDKAEEAKDVPTGAPMIFQVLSSFHAQDVSETTTHSNLF